MKEHRTAQVLNIDEERRKRAEAAERETARAFHELFWGGDSIFKFPDTEKNDTTAPKK